MLVLFFVACPRACVSLLLSFCFALLCDFLVRQLYSFTNRTYATMQCGWGKNKYFKKYQSALRYSVFVRFKLEQSFAFSSSCPSFVRYFCSFTNRINTIAQGKQVPKRMAQGSLVCHKQSICMHSVRPTLSFRFVIRLCSVISLFHHKLYLQYIVQQVGTETDGPRTLVCLKQSLYIHSFETIL